MNVALPEGYCITPLLEQHERGAVDLMNLYNRRVNSGGDLTTLEEMRIEWQDEEFNRAVDTRLVLSPAGQVVGYADVWDINALHVRQYAFVLTHPDFMNLGIGRCLMEWSIERARQKGELAPQGARVVLHQVSRDTNLAAHQMLTRGGFSVVRRSYRMQIEFDLPPENPSIPAGIHIRPMVKEEARAALQANYEAFGDHWGHVEEPFDDYFKRWSYYLESDPNIVPEFWFLAFDGEQIAGVAFCIPHVTEDPDMGWVWQLSVRRPWRKHGLGLALLQYAFAEFYRIGRKRAALGVDASSLTGATRLYERAGMHIQHISNTYEYELRSGKDLMTKEIS